MSAIKPHPCHSWLLLALLLSACSTGSQGPAAPATSPYVAVARGRVDVEGGLVALSAPRDGTISRIHVHEGQSVHQGDPLLELESSATQLAIHAADAELGQARAEVEVLSGQQAAASTRAQRLHAAAAAGAGEGQMADDAQATATQLAAQREVALAGVAAATAKRAAALNELALRTLRAPQDAEVIRVTAQTGAAVGPQSGTLVTLLPQTPRIIRAELSEAYVEQVRVQMPATVSAEQDSGHSWPARVLRISTVVGPSLLEEDPQRRPAVRTVECVLSLDAPVPLRVGQRVLVRIGAAPGAAKD